MSILLALIQSVLGKLVGDEVISRWPSLIHRIVGLAAKLLPQSCREDTRAEWLAIVEDIPGPLSKLGQSLDLIRGAWWISFQHYRVQNRRDWQFALGTVQASVGVGGFFILKAMKVLSLFRGSTSLMAMQIGCLTFAVQGLGKHAQAYLEAADRFDELGNLELAAECKSNGEKLAVPALERFIDVAILQAFRRLDEPSE